MQCGVGLCGHCQLGPTLICRDGPVYRWDELEPLHGGAGAVSVAQAEARRLEVRLVRRLPALAARLRGRAARARGRGRDRLLPRGDAARPSRARTTSRSSRARSRPRTTRSGSSEVRRAVAAARHDRRLRDRRRHPGAEELRRRRTSSSRSSTPRPEYISTLATSTPISGARPRRLRAARLPDRQAPAARGDHARSSTAAGRTSRRRASAWSASARGNVCVMVAHGTPCLGPVTHAGCGALCPAYDRGCYGCFGPMETPNTVSLTQQLSVLGMERAGRRARLPDVQRRRRSRTCATRWLSADEDDQDRLPRPRRGRGRDARQDRGRPGRPT